MGSVFLFKDVNEPIPVRVAIGIGNSDIHAFGIGYCGARVGIGPEFIQVVESISVGVGVSTRGCGIDNTIANCSDIRHDQRACGLKRRAEMQSLPPVVHAVHIPVDYAIQLFGRVA